MYLQQFNDFLRYRGQLRRVVAVLSNQRPNASSQPHLVVAWAQIAKGRTVNPGDHIPYVICKKTEEGVKQTPAQRARAPDEILRSRKTEKPLEVDYEWCVQCVFFFF